MKKLLFLLAAGLLSVVAAQAQTSVQITGYGFSTPDYDYRFVFTVSGYVDNGAFVPTSVDPVPKVIRINHGLPISVEIEGAVSNCRAYIIPEESSPGPDRSFFCSFDYHVERYQGHWEGTGIIPWRIR